MSTTFTRMNMPGADVWYCESFFADEAEELFLQIDHTTVWETFQVKVFGKVHDQPRQSSYMADDLHVYKYAGFDRKPSEWSDPAQILRKMLTKVVREISPGHPRLNALLLNRYDNGLHYIGDHADDENDLQEGAFIVSVSLGASRDFVFTHKKTKEKVTMKLKSGSIVLMGGDCQKNWKHGVPKRMGVKEPRINATFRSIVAR